MEIITRKLNIVLLLLCVLIITLCNTLLKEVDWPVVCAAWILYLMFHKK